MQFLLLPILLIFALILGGIISFIMVQPMPLEMRKDKVIKQLKYPFTIFFILLIFWIVSNLIRFF